GGSMRSSPARAAELLHAGGPAGARRGYYHQPPAGARGARPPPLPPPRPPAPGLARGGRPPIPPGHRRLMHPPVPRSELHVYRGGHLDLIAEPHRLAPVIERFLRADAAAEREAIR